VRLTEFDADWTPTIDRPTSSSAGFIKNYAQVLNGVRNGAAEAVGAY
jgi:hypothetical protein